MLNAEYSTETAVAEVSTLSNSKRLALQIGQTAMQIYWQHVPRKFRIAWQTGASLAIDLTRDEFVGAFNLADQDTERYELVGQVQRQGQQLLLYPPNEADICVLVLSDGVRERLRALLQESQRPIRAPLSAAYLMQPRRCC